MFIKGDWVRKFLLWLVTLLLFAHALQSILLGIKYSHAITIGFAVFTLLTSILVALDKPWSKYLVHIVSMIVIGFWLYGVISYYLDHGIYSLELMQVIIGLIPGMLLCLLFIGCSTIVHVYMTIRDI
jgi:hypothetical protein